MHFSSRLRMRSVFFAQGRFFHSQSTILKQSSPGLREQLRDRLQSVMQADRLMSSHVPSSLYCSNMLSSSSSQVILPFIARRQSLTMDSQKVFHNFGPISGAPWQLDAWSPSAASESLSATFVQRLERETSEKRHEQVSTYHENL